MGTTERKAREREQRRNLIIDAAEKIFFSKGLTNSTMDEVAEKTELSKGTLYLYFKSKEELFFAINQRGIKILSSICEEASSKNKKGIDKVVEIGRAFIHFYTNYRDYFNTMMQCKSFENESNREMLYVLESQAEGDKALSILIEAINSGIKDKSIRGDLHPFMTALSIWGQVSGLLQIISFKEEKLKNNFDLTKDDLINYSFGLIRDLLKTNKAK